MKAPEKVDTASSIGSAMLRAMTLTPESRVVPSGAKIVPEMLAVVAKNVADG